MEFIATLVQIVNIIAALAVVVLVLMQHGKGADMGAAFGSGSAGSLFGSAGSANFLSRSTAFCAVVFFVTCLALAALSTPKKAAESVLAGVPVAASQPAAASHPASASQADQKKIPD